MGERLKRASYREAIEWIALNDEPSCRDPEWLPTTVTALLIADIFGADPARVGRDVLRYRIKHDV